MKKGVQVIGGIELLQRRKRRMLTHLRARLHFPHHKKAFIQRILIQTGKMNKVLHPFRIKRGLRRNAFHKIGAPPDKNGLPDLRYGFHATAP